MKITICNQIHLQQDFDQSCQRCLFQSLNHSSSNHLSIPEFKLDTNVYEIGLVLTQPSANSFKANSMVKMKVNASLTVPNKFV